MLPDVLTVNPGSTSTKLTRWIAGREVAPPDSFDTAVGSHPSPAVVVYRVVHGGDRVGAEVLDDGVVADLRSLCELAPLHQPASLQAIDRGCAAWPKATHIACFDTSFHTTIPEAARTYGLPARLRSLVRVYGFHGLSYAWATACTREVLPDSRRVLVAHLGGGQSLCGVLDGRSTITTMGFTPLDGLVMATRCGAMDPGALLYLLGRGEEDLSRVLERESGLLGLGGSGDMREILTRSREGAPAARLARDVWLHRLVQQAGGCVAVLGGLDVLVFTGGIGERSEQARSLVADQLAWLGVAIRSDSPATRWVSDISRPEASVRTLIVRSREDLQMVGEAERLLEGRRPGPRSVPHGEPATAPRLSTRPA